MYPESLGKAISDLRERKGVGLRELARRAKVSTALLSTIEAGNGNPTLATLHKLLKALGTDFARFFGTPAETTDSPVFPSKKMHRATDAHREYVFAFPNLSHLKFQLLHETILPTEKQSQWEVHDCDVGAFVLAGGPGRLEIKGQGQWPLKKGDAFYIPSCLEHRGVNVGKHPLRLITVMAPAKY